MKFKTKLMSAAVLAAVGATSAQAVTVSDDGLGQVLLYPYYTVENGMNTLISVVNTTSFGKAVKVRFLESLNSREVLDFNLYLSPLDVWTGMITADAGGGAKVVVTDTSCTAPAIATAIGGTGEQAFFTYGFDGSSGVAADAEAGRGIARTREGYIEIIEMGNIDPEYVMQTPAANFLGSITHTAGVPKNCAAVAAEWAGTQFPNNGSGSLSATFDLAGLTAPTGGLMGQGTLINVTQGTDYSYDPTPLAGFTTQPNHSAPGSLRPSLADGIPVSTVVLVDQATGAANVITDVWPHASYGPVDAVSAALMRSAVLDEFIVNTAIHASTDWVITMPTKRWYVDKASMFAPNDIVSHGVRPFQSVFTTGGACETISMTFTNQEEDKKTGTIGFSPAPLGKSQAICWEANVITFNNGNVLHSPQTASSHNVNVGTYPAGWLSLGFPVSSSNASNLPDDPIGGPGVGVDTGTDAADVLAHRLTDSGTHTYGGLPVIGFSVQQYVNDVLGGGVLSNYGGNFNHKYLRSIQ
jgi:hypothetical protein